MSAFYPGQKVRKVRGPINVGATGTFARWLGPDEHFIADCEVRPDTSVMSILGYLVPGGMPHPTTSGDWEPIIPEGLESREEIDALYEPSPEVVTVVSVRTGFLP